MPSYEGDWKSGHVWKVIEVNTAFPAEDPAKKDIVMFVGSGLGGSNSRMKVSGEPEKWGEECTYQANGTVQVKHGGIQYTAERSGSLITCKNGSSSSSFEAREEAVTTTTQYNRDWASTRIWTVQSVSGFTDLAVNDILIFTGDGNGPGSELKKSKPRGPDTLRFRCKYNSDTVRVIKEGGARFSIKRLPSKTPVQLKYSDVFGDDVVTGATWTAEEGG